MTTKKTKTKTKTNGTSTPTTSEDDVRAKVQEVIDQLRAAFTGRDAVARGIICALLAGEHAFLLGPKGTGKSAITRAVCGAIDAGTYWEYLFTRYTEPNEVFGPIDLKAWSDKGDYERRTAGYLPEAHIAFADEVFKANSSILNALLSVMNERIFHQGGAPITVPLRTMIGASNELPEGGTAGELAALYDRFLMRFEVTKPRGRSAFRSVVGAAQEMPTITARITLDELAAAQAYAAAVDLPESTIDSMQALDEELFNGLSIDTSHRRWKKLKKILCAHAWLDGDSVVDPLHFDILQHALWDEPNQRAKVASIIGKTTAPNLAEALEVHDSIMELVNGLPSQGNLGAEGTSVNAELSKAIDRVDTLLEAEKSDAVKRRMEEVADRMDTAAEALEKRIHEELFPTGRGRRARKRAEEQS